MCKFCRPYSQFSIESFKQVTRLVVTWLHSAVTTVYVLSTHPAPILHQLYFSSHAFSLHAHAMHIFDVWGSSSSPRLPLCQILFLSHPPLLS